jgi:hypothetical protein
MSNRRRILRFAIVVVPISVWLAAAVTVGAKSKTNVTIKQDLVSTGRDPDATGKASTSIRKISKRFGGLEARLRVEVRKLDQGVYDVSLDGVRIGELVTNKRGSGKAEFKTARLSSGNTNANGNANANGNTNSSSSSASKRQLLGVDPRGLIVVVSSPGGPALLQLAIDTANLDPNKVRCCLPDDSGTECEARTAAECVAEGGIDMGAGSCVPNPCAGVGAPGGDVRCCLPDDSGPECEDRTAAECAAVQGINVGAGTCLPNPCAGTEPDPNTNSNGNTNGNSNTNSNANGNTNGNGNSNENSNSNSNENDNSNSDDHGGRGRR